MRKTATKDTWKNFPIDDPKRIKIDLHFDQEQFEIMKQGLIPKEMEDKWFIYYENRWFYFHRSWTGYGIYKAKVNQIHDGYTIKEFWAERNWDKYQNKNDDSDINTISHLIYGGLLDMDFSKVIQLLNLTSGEDALKKWSNFGSLLFKNTDLDD